MRAPLAGGAVEFGDQVLAGDAALHQAAEAFAGVFVDDRDDLDRPPEGTLARSLPESNEACAARAASPKAIARDGLHRVGRRGPGLGKTPVS
jgi:hypothetical protein